MEDRRRSKTLPRFFTEQSCVKLVFATLIRAAERWQRIARTPLEYARLHARLHVLYQEHGLVPAKPLSESPNSKTPDTSRRLNSYRRVRT